MTKGKDLSINPVCRTIAFDKPREMVFNNAMFREVEKVYETVYGKDWGIDEILEDLYKSKYRAIEAVTYGALVAAGEEIDWDDFDKNVFSFAGIEGLAEFLPEAVGDMLPEIVIGEDAEGN